MTTDVQTIRPVTAREGYERWAAVYDEFENPMTAMVSHVLRRPTIDLCGARVLELGCGTGRNMDRLFEHRIRSYTGIDGSPEMLAVAEQRRTDHGDVRLEMRDLQGTWWEDLDQYDLVLISLVLEHIEHVTPVLRGAAQVAAPNADLWILELHSERHEAGVRAHVSTDTQTLALPSFAHDARELRTAMQATRWEPVATTAWCPTAAQAQGHPKLGRYLGSPVLLEVRGRWSEDAATSS